jgi:uncharacterized membrane protein
MNGNWLFVLLRVVHVVAGVLWVGGVVFMTRFLLPSARAAGPGAGPMMQQLSARKLAAYTPVVAVLTVLAGLGLYWHDSQGFNSHEWLRSPSAMTFGTGGILALLVLVLGLVVISPAGKRMTALGAGMQQAGGPPAPEQIAEMQALHARMAWSSRTASVLLIITTMLMAVARYV